MLKQDRIRLSMAYSIAARELDNDDLQGIINSLNLYAQKAEERGDFIAASVFTHTLELINDYDQPENERLELL